MITDKDHILIFKTNIREPGDVSRVKIILEQIPHVKGWSIDTEDTDCVLRVISHAMEVSQVVNLITDNGYECRELES